MEWIIFPLRLVQFQNGGFVARGKSGVLSIHLLFRAMTSNFKHHLQLCGPTATLKEVGIFLAHVRRRPERPLSGSKNIENVDPSIEFRQLYAPFLANRV